MDRDHYDRYMKFLDFALKINGDINTSNIELGTSTYTDRSRSELSELSASASRKVKPVIKLPLKMVREDETN